MRKCIEIDFGNFLLRVRLAAGAFFLEKIKFLRVRLAAGVFFVEKK